jgi:hypothetical protein
MGSRRVDLPSGATEMTVRLITTTEGRASIKGSPAVVTVVSFGVMHFNTQLFVLGSVTPKVA